MFFLFSGFVSNYKNDFVCFSFGKNKKCCIIFTCIRIQTLFLTPLIVVDVDSPQLGVCFSFNFSQFRC